MYIDMYVFMCACKCRSRDNRHEIAKQVAQIAIKAFLRILGLASAPLRLLVSEAILWEHGRVSEPGKCACASRERERERDRERERERERETDRERERDVRQGTGTHF
jgi:hypothetical protein